MKNFTQTLLENWGGKMPPKSFYEDSFTLTPKITKTIQENPEQYVSWIQIEIFSTKYSKSNPKTYKKVYAWWQNWAYPRNTKLG